MKGAGLGRGGGAWTTGFYFETCTDFDCFFKQISFKIAKRRNSLQSRGDATEGLIRIESIQELGFLFFIFF